MQASNSVMGGEWVVVGKLDEIPVKGARIVKTSQGNVAVFRTSGNKVFALRDKCPHKGGPLSQGIVHDSLVTCPLHNWTIDLSSGQAQGPDEGCTNTFPVQIENDEMVYILLSS